MFYHFIRISVFGTMKNFSLYIMICISRQTQPAKTCTMKKIFQTFSFGVIVFCFHYIFPAPLASAETCPGTLRELKPLPISAHTGMKPQSKLWFHAQQWWAVLPQDSGTFVWRLNGDAWEKVRQLSRESQTRADVKSDGAITHVLLFSGEKSSLASITYDGKTYQPWSSKRPELTEIQFSPHTETATIDLDAAGRMWLAYDTLDEIQVRWSDPPYRVWSAPVTLAAGVSKDDICVITALPQNRVAVLWSNQNSQRFGFRTHRSGDEASVWSDEEVPAAQSALPVGNGMADDHLNVCVAQNGTLFAAVKTSYDTPGYPKVALLVRRSNGVWDDLYGVAEIGTRGNVLLNEKLQKIYVIYTGSDAMNQILLRESRTDSIALSPPCVLIDRKVNNVTSTKQNGTGEMVILASDNAAAWGVVLGE